MALDGLSGRTDVGQVDARRVLLTRLAGNRHRTRTRKPRDVGGSNPHPSSPPDFIFHTLGGQKRTRRRVRASPLQSCNVHRRFAPDDFCRTVMRPRAGIHTTPDTRAPPSPPRGPPIVPLPILRPTKSTPPPPPPSGSAPRSTPGHSDADAPVPKATRAAPAEAPESPPPSRTHPAPAPRTPPTPSSHAREAPPRSRPEASPDASRRTRLRCVLGTCSIRPSPQPRVAGRRSSSGAAAAKHDADVRTPDVPARRPTLVRRGFRRYTRTFRLGEGRPASAKADAGRSGFTTRD